MRTHPPLVAIEMLGGFGAGKTTLCDALAKRLVAEGAHVYRQKDYSAWRLGLGRRDKIRALLMATPDLVIIAIIGLYYVLYGGSYCPSIERCQRLTRAMRQRAFLSAFAVGRDGFLLLDEWHVNQFATISMPNGCESLSPILARALYSGVKYVFVYVERDIDQATNNILRRAADNPGPPVDCRNIAAKIMYRVEDVTRIRACAQSSARFHKGSREVFFRNGMKIIDCATNEVMTAREVMREGAMAR